MVLCQRGTNKRAQLLLILRRCNKEAWNLALGGKHEHALMARAIFTDKTGTVHPDQHWLIILANVMHDLVPRSLQEGRIDRNHWSTATHGDTSRGSNGVLLGDANVIEAIWIGGGELVEPGSCWHSCRNGHNAPVGRSGGDYLSGEEGGVVWHLGRGCDRVGTRLAVGIGSANRNLGECCAVEGDRIYFSRAIAATLLGTHMHDHRAVHGECLREGLFKLRSVVPIEHTDIGDAEVFKEAPWLLHERDNGAAQALRPSCKLRANERHARDGAVVPALAFAPATGELHL